MIVPSIDIQNGRAVQLRQGRDLVLTAAESPLELAKRFDRYGPVAVVDLDAALGRGHNRELVKQICRVAQVRVGGGLRSAESALDLLRAGAEYVIIGTAAEPELLKRLPDERVIVALDHRKGVVHDKGWTQSIGVSVHEMALHLARYCSRFLCTFIDQEGCQAGMPMDWALALAKDLPRPVTFAGGVASTEEAVRLCRSGLEIQVGLALYRGDLNLTETVIRSLDFEKANLMPTVVQDEYGQVMMLAYSSPESLRRALDQGRGIYFSRSRQALWEKGAVSGHTQELIRCRADCDRDSLLFTVRQKGSACHTESFSCFGQTRFSAGRLVTKLHDRRKHGTIASYTNRLLNDPETLDRKLIEEAFELTRAASPEAVRWEAADLIYHLLVKAVQYGLSWPDLLSELASRQRRRK